jgi:adenosine deaminase
LTRVAAGHTEELAELHVHLEGTVSARTAAELAARHHIAAPPPYRYSNLTRFLAIYADVCATMRTAEDFERVILEHAASMAEQNIAYAEVSINPSMHAGEEWLPGVDSGRHAARQRYGVDVAWLVELVRGAPLDMNERALAIAVRLDGCVGLGLVGDESLDSAALVPLLERARKAGLRFMPHAGQSGRAGPVREALDVLRADRIAHGVGALEDAALLTELRTHGVCLCVCPSSNRAIGLRPDFRALAAAGIALSVNSDDPAMVRTTLRRELDIAETRLGLDRPALVAAAWRHRFRRSTTAATQPHA